MFSAFKTIICFILLGDCLANGAQGLLNFEQTIHGINAFKSLLTNNTISSTLYEFERTIKLNPNSESMLKQSLLNFEYTDLRLGANVSEDCLEQLEYFGSALKAKEFWAFEVIDSFGKLPSGIVKGHLAWLGEFSECQNITSGNFTGQHVMLSKPPNLNDMFRNGQIAFKYGICAPDRCSKADIVNVINFVLSIVQVPLSMAHLLDLKQIDESNVVFHQHRSLDAAAIITLSFIGFIVLVVLVGTLYDIQKRLVHHIRCEELRSSSTRALLTNADSTIDTDLDQDLGVDEEVLYCNSVKEWCLFSQILVSFSAYSNCKKIFKINANANELACLHGIRVLSLCWVILGHGYVFALSFSDNPSCFIDYVKRFSFLVVSNAFFSVDSFFVLSGFLTSYVFFMHVRSEKLSLGLMVRYYLHRYWRLSPVYFTCMLVSINLSTYFGTGPLFPSDSGFELDKCQNTWYWNVLYINNLIDPNHMCFTISWYLANDMQFHIIAPLVLVPLALKFHKTGFIVLAGLLVGNIVSIPLILNTMPGAESAQFGPRFIEFFQHIYIVPWARIAPYLFGLFTGYLIFLYKSGQSQLNLPRSVNLILWLISCTLMTLVVFGLYPDISGNPISRSGHIIYQTLSRVSWSVGLSYIIFACVTSNGGVVNKILSWPVWTPLSRVTYSTFLVHIMFIMYYYTTREHLIHVTDLGMVYTFVANAFISYALGFLVNIFVESPMLGIEKFIFSRQ